MERFTRFQHDPKNPSSLSKTLLSYPWWKTVRVSSGSARPVAVSIDSTAQTKLLQIYVMIPNEVFKVVLRERGEDGALQAIALMKQGNIVVLNEDIAFYAAKISFENKILMADSVVLATAQALEAIIWTPDSDFKKFSGVKFFQ